MLLTPGKVDDKADCGEYDSRIYEELSIGHFRKQWFDNRPVEERPLLYSRIVWCS